MFGNNSKRYNDIKQVCEGTFYVDFETTAANTSGAGIISSLFSTKTPIQHIRDNNYHFELSRIVFYRDVEKVRRQFILSATSNASLNEMYKNIIILQQTRKNKESKVTQCYYDNPLFLSSEYSDLIGAVKELEGLLAYRVYKQSLKLGKKSLTGDEKKTLLSKTATVAQVALAVAQLLDITFSKSNDYSGEKKLELINAHYESINQQIPPGSVNEKIIKYAVCGLAATASFIVSGTAGFALGFTFSCVGALGLGFSAPIAGVSLIVAGVISLAIGLGCACAAAFATGIYTKDYIHRKNFTAHERSAIDAIVHNAKEKVAQIHRLDRDSAETYLSNQQEKKDKRRSVRRNDKKKTEEKNSDREGAILIPYYPR